MPIAWPDVKRAEVFDWAINEFAERAASYVIYQQLEQKPLIEADDPDLQKALSFYLEDRQDEFIELLDHLTGRIDPTWSMSDFGFEAEVEPGKTAKTDELSSEARQNLRYLSLEFLGYLRREESIPYTKGRLAQRQIFAYLVERHAGELVSQESFLDAAMRGPKQRNKPKRKQRAPDHWLCPDRGTMDRFLAGLLGMFSGRYYEAVATFELIPAWLRFLESRQLIDEEQHSQTLAKLRGMDTELLKVVEDFSDPALKHALERWREQ